MAEITTGTDLQQRVESLERELHLKQLQINRLLNITQAINNNIKFEDLFRMYQSFLSWEMGITRMALFVRDKRESDWVCPVYIGLQAAFIERDGDIGHLLPAFSRLTKLDDAEHPFLRAFQLVIPVMHKDQAIAYAFLGNLEGDEDLYNRVQFITTITNVVAVALENKRLFKRQLEQERLKREMELASDIQRMLVPASLPGGKHYEVASIYMPQLGVGGDYYDFFAHHPEQLRFCVADISGKGLAAAMIMSNFQASLHSLLMQQLDLDTLMRRLNQVVYRITKGERFITLFYGEYDAREGVLHYINAGHVPSLLVRQGQLHAMDVGCTILGCFPELPELAIGREPIPPGSLLFNYTDGLTDLKNDAGDFVSEQLLHDFVRQHAALDPDSFNHQLLACMARFRGQQPFLDDVTVLTCRLC